MKELITKSSDGGFILTQAGEQELYFITTRKLIQYYLKEVLKKDANSIAETTASLTIFLSQNFKKVDDYLQKLPELANFIKESNLEKFQKFMGQYFINTLQKEKQVLIKRESEQGKEKLENPFWAPSNEMLKNLEAELLKAPPLKFPPDGQNGVTPQSAGGNDTKPENLQTKSNQKNMDVNSRVLENEPGVLLLETFEKEFLSAKPLDLKSFESAEIADTNNNNNNKNPTANNKPVPEIRESLDFDPPGVRLLTMVGQAFINSPPLENTSGKVIEGATDKIPAEKHLISLKAFASILSNISKFSKTKDTAGYQNWYINLAPKLKAAVKINSMYNAEKKGEEVNWGQEIMKYAASTNENKDDLYQLREEVRLYIKIINFIRHRLTSDPKIKIPPQEASNIYVQSINILSGNESVTEKKSAITILLFQITDPSIREILLKDFEKILSSL